MVKSQGVSSEPFDIHYAPPAPPVPVITSVWGDGNNHGGIADGDNTDDATPYIRGNNVGSFAAVEIWLNGQRLDVVYADNFGNWSYTPTLSEGLNQIVVKSQGVSSEPFDIHYAPPAPSVPVPVITSVLADENSYGKIANGDSTDDATPRITGNNVARYAHVEIWINGQHVETVLADNLGHWAYMPTLSEGQNQIVVKAQGVSSEPFNVTYEPLVVPVEPELAITAIRDLATGQIIEPNNAPESAAVRLFGKGPANQWVQIWLGDTQIGTVFTNFQGDWRMPIDLQLGDNVLTVRVGNQQSEPVLVNLPALNLPAPEIIAIEADEFNPGQVQNGDTTNDDTLRIIGRVSQPFGSVEIWINDQLIQTLQANQNGSWSYWATLTEGQNNIVAVSRGVASEAFVVEYQPVEGPVTTPAPEIWSVFADDFTQVHNGDTTQSATPQISGRAEAGMRVQLWVNDVMIDDTYADRNGLWYFTPRLTEGVNRIVVKSNGAESDVFELTYQPIVVPVEPELSIVYHSEFWEGNTTTAERQSIFSGKAPAGSLVTLYINDQPVTTIEVSGAGDWTFATALFDGENSLKIGIDGQFSDAVSVTVQGSPAPAIHTAYDDVGVNWVLSHNGVTDDATPLLRGVSAPNAIIHLYVDGQPFGSVRAEMTGIWQAEVSLNPGLNAIHVVENGVPSEDFYLTLEDAPVITGLYADGELIENGGASAETDFILHGSAQPHARVEIYNSGSSLPIVVTADADGNWSHRVTALEGENTYFAVSNGQWSEAFFFTYLLELEEPALPEQPEQAAFPIDEPENIEQYSNVPSIAVVHDSVSTMPWLVNTGSWTDDAQPELYGYLARPHSIVTILDGEKNVVGTALADSNGDWRFTPDEPLSPGQWDFSAANEYGISGNTFTVNIRDLDPAPSMFAFDDAGDYRGIRPSGSFTDDATPTFYGSSNPNKLISLYDQDNQLIATTTSNWNGSWTINIETSLQPGTHSFVARDEDGKSSDSYVLNIKTSDDAPWPEISSLLADGDAMLFAAQTVNDEQDEFVALTISEADMAHSSLHDALSSDVAANQPLNIELLDEHQSLTQG